MKGSRIEVSFSKSMSFRNIYNNIYIRVSGEERQQDSNEKEAKTAGKR